MKTFLQEVAERLLHDHPQDMSRVLVVFNNRRPALYLKQQLSRLQAQRPAFFYPCMMGMDDLVGELCPLKITQKEFLLFDLFAVHRQVADEEHRADTFEDFISLGEMMLSDFSDIDLYRVDAAALFSNLHDLKAIGEWNIEEPQLNNFQKKYLAFYKSLYLYYTHLRQSLQAQHKAYGGMAYRDAAEHLEERLPLLHYSHIYFVGFNVLSTCEQDIMQGLMQHLPTTIIADGDPFYVDNPDHEAGLFLRRQRSWAHLPEAFPNLLGAEPKEIHIVSCPETIAEVKYTGNLLHKLLPPQTETPAAPPAEPLPPDNTCIVLADENLLTPLLNSLPAEVTGANITMGLPYQQSALHLLVLQLLQLYRNSKDGRYYHADFSALMSNPTLGQLLQVPDLYAKVFQYLSQNKLIYLDISTIETLFQNIKVSMEPLLPLFAQSQERTCSTETFLQRMGTLLDLLSHDEHIPPHSTTHEALICCAELMEHLSELQQQHHYMDSLGTLEKVYTRLARRHNIALYGEPLHGLQILGVLESRCLDFQHLILLSANEGILPSGKTQNTLIPYALKKAYHIPSYSEKDAMYAYCFYRMLQRASHITILYHTETDSTGKGEPSRFLSQLEWEVAPQFPNIHITKSTANIAGSTLHACYEQSIPKTEAILQQLQHHAATGFSPSALTTYRSCPLKFYYRYVLHIAEEQEVDEAFDAGELGSFIHDILQLIHDTDKGKPLDAATLQAQLKDLDHIVDNYFDQHYRYGRAMEGMNHYNRHIAKAQIAALLQQELDLLQQGHTLQIVMAEEDLSAPLPLPSQPHIPVNIKGRVDRIDRYDGQLRIVDYKTGKVDAKELQYTAPLSAPEQAEKPCSDKWLQVLTYAWLYHHSHPQETIESGIYPLRNLRSHLLTAEWNDTTLLTQAHLQAFQQLLQSLVADLMDPQVPLQATPSNEACRYCPYTAVCRPEE